MKSFYKSASLLFIGVLLGYLLVITVVANTPLAVPEPIYITEVLEVEKLVEVPCMPPYTAEITAYCPCTICSGHWGRQTKLGVLAEPSHTIAVDKLWIPPHTELSITGFEGITFYAEDVGGAIKSNDIDMFFATHDEALEFGRQWLTVRVTKWGYGEWPE